jgi:hypothetical protein
VAHASVAADGSYSVPLALNSGSYRARVAPGRGFAVGISETLVVQ